MGSRGSFPARLRYRGYTKEEALEALQDAAQAYVEVLLEDGDPLPRGEEEVASIIPGSESVTVTISAVEVESS